MHRLLIADERREGIVPLSVLFAGALKERGYELCLFQIGFDEVFTRYLEIVTGEPVTVMDPFMLHKDFSCKYMFQECAEKNKLNLFLAPLAEPQRHEEKIALDKTTAKLADVLALPMLPLLFADRNAVLTAQLTEQIFSQMREYYHILPFGVCFAAAMNPREYQLLEIEVGRRLPCFPLGYLPKNTVRKTIDPAYLFSEEERSIKFMALHAAVGQLAAQEDMVNWVVPGAMAKRAKPWAKIREEFDEVSGIKTVGVLRHSCFSGAGGGNERFFEHLGATLLSLSLEDSQNVSKCDVLYVPHGRIEYLKNPEELTALKRTLGMAVFRKIPFFVQGASVALLGESLVHSGGEHFKGVGMFPFTSYLDQGELFSSPVYVEGTLSGALLREKDVVHGYLSRGCRMEVPSARQGYWSVRRSEEGGEIATDGWVMGKGLMTRTCLSFWEIPQSIRTWINSR